MVASRSRHFLLLFVFRSVWTSARLYRKSIQLYVHCVKLSIIYIVQSRCLYRLCPNRPPVRVSRLRVQVSTRQYIWHSKLFTSLIWSICLSTHSVWIACFDVGQSASSFEQSVFNFEQSVWMSLILINGLGDRLQLYLVKENFPKRMRWNHRHI